MTGSAKVHVHALHEGRLIDQLGTFTEVFMTPDLTIIGLPGVEAGADPRVAVVLKVAEGGAVVAGVTLATFLTAAEALRARFGDPRDGAPQLRDLAAWLALSEEPPTSDFGLRGDRAPGYWGMNFGEDEAYELAVEPTVFAGVHELALYRHGDLVTARKIVVRLGWADTQAEVRRTVTAAVAARQQWSETMTEQTDDTSEIVTLTLTKQDVIDLMLFLAVAGADKETRPETLRRSVALSALLAEQSGLVGGGVATTTD